MLNANSVVEFAIKDMDSYLRSSLRNKIMATLGFGAIGLWCVLSGIYIGQKDNGIIAMIFGLLVGGGVLVAAYDSWQLWQNAAAESQLVRRSSNPGIKISTDEISILAVLLDDSARRVLFEQQKVSLDLNWNDIHSIIVQDSDEGSDRVYEVSLGKDKSETLQRYGLKDSDVWIQRKPFFGKEEMLIEAFKKYAKCQIQMKDKLR